MPAHGHPLPVDEAQGVNGVDGCLGVGDQLRSEGVVGLFISLPDDREGCVVEHRVTLCYPVDHRAVPGIGELVGVLGVLPRARLVLEFLGIGPDQQGKLLLLLHIIAHGQVQGARKLQAVLPLVFDHFLITPRYALEGVLVEGQLGELLLVRASLLQLAEIIVRILGGGLDPHHELPGFRVELLQRFDLAFQPRLVKTLLFTRFQNDTVQEGKLPLFGVSLPEQVGRTLFQGQDRPSHLVAGGHKTPGIAVLVLVVPIEQDLWLF